MVEAWLLHYLKRYNITRFAVSAVAGEHNYRKDTKYIHYEPNQTYPYVAGYLCWVEYIYRHQKTLAGWYVQPQQHYMVAPQHLIRLSTITWQAAYIRHLTSYALVGEGDETLALPLPEWLVLSWLN